MANWNSNRNNTYNNNLQPQAPPFYPSGNSQQQYVGFNDFLNQYQMSGNTYQPQQNTFQHNSVDQYRAGNNYNTSYNVNGTVVYPQHASMSQQNNYQGIPSSYTQVPLTQDNNVMSNNVNSGYAAQNKENAYQTSSVNDSRHTVADGKRESLIFTNTDNSFVSSSKLTATAQEFVPQGFKNQTTVKTNNPVKETKSSSVEPSTSGRYNNSANAPPNNSNNSGNKKKIESNKSHDNYNSRRANAFSRSKYENTNWRSRDDDDDDEAEPNAEQSITVYNSSNRSNADENTTNQRYNRNANNSRDKPKDKSYANNRNKDYNSQHRGDRANNYDNSNQSNKQRDGYRSRDGRNGANAETSAENYSRDRDDYYSEDNNDRYNYSYRNHRGDNASENRNRNNQSGNNSRPRSSYGGESYKQRNVESRDAHGKDRNEGTPARRKDKEMDDGDYLEKSPLPKDNANINQRERLIEQLNRGNLECLVCCDRVRQQDSVWSCGSCFHVLHLNCIKKWANSSLQDGLWRCPACQNQLSEIPSAYRCFCGSQRNPEWHRGGVDTAHSCGDICNKTRSCAIHPCTLPCHPGPCPVCESIIQKKCECGATQQLLKCSHKAALLCSGICSKPLECKVHSCEEKCHEGACPTCKEVIEQKCYCPRQKAQTVGCESSTVGVTGYACGEVCGRKLLCGSHECHEVCHPGPCPQCPYSPEVVTHCHCGQTRLEKKRTSCMDPVPTCDKPCSLPLGCGPNDSLHLCPAPCHDEDCPPCKLRTPVSCRCGHITKEIPCVQLQEMKETIRCGRKCAKKQSCGRHKCKETCCIDSEHKCPLPCTRTLSCGLHRCEDTCHRGHCQPCWRVSFEELRCRCGASVRYPPVECGARPPSCSKPCTVARPCNHPPHHTCHPAHTHCPPCTVLTQRYCHGRHKLRKTIPCHQEDFSCGLPCGKDMPCGKHKCVESCHKGDCPTVCTQVCNTERHGCGHPCGAKCGHPAPCPSLTPCKAPVTAKCPCGRRSEIRPCYEQTAAQRKLQVLLGPLGEPVDIGELIKQGSNQVTLECDLDCQTEDRNRRLAIGLQIRNPDLSSKLAPKYSDYLKQMCTRDENFATRIHDQLRQLVVLAKDSKQRTRSHSFQPMSRPKRQFVHELCQHFGCESASYDSEPYRNIVATAYKERSWLPAMSLMEVVRRDKGQRKVPPPILNSSSGSGGSAWATLGSSSSMSATTTASSVPEPPRKPKIDYFDMPPED